MSQVYYNPLPPSPHTRTQTYIRTISTAVDAAPHTHWNTRTVHTYVPKEHTDGIGKQKGVVQDAKFCLPFWSIYTREQDTWQNEVTCDKIQWHSHLPQPAIPCMVSQQLQPLLFQPPWRTYTIHVSGSVYKLACNLYKFTKAPVTLRMSKMTVTTMTR